VKQEDFDSLWGWVSRSLFEKEGSARPTGASGADEDKLAEGKDWTSTGQVRVFVCAGGGFHFAFACRKIAH